MQAGRSYNSSVPVDEYPVLSDLHMGLCMKLGCFWHLPGSAETFLDQIWGVSQSPPDPFLLGCFFWNTGRPYNSVLTCIANWDAQVTPHLPFDQTTQYTSDHYVVLAWRELTASGSDMMRFYCAVSTNEVLSNVHITQYTSTGYVLSTSALGVS